MSDYKFNNASNFLGINMKKADLHVHSLYSEHPDEWFLQRLGAAESYTEPETVYRMAKEKGMDYVTITDHNRIQGALVLNEKHPGEIITGVESTVYFPEDKCKVHILLYGLSPQQFEVIQKVRKDIYQFHAYVIEQQLVASVAHATYAVNNRLKMHHLEKLILMFNIFESINGGRNRMNNQGWADAVGKLTPRHIEEFFSKHRIEPHGDDPWIKGFTGGSDDHAGIFIADTYTSVETDTIEGFVRGIGARKGRPNGRHNTFQGLVFSIYKVAYDFSRAKGKGLATSPIGSITEAIFENRALPLSSQIKFGGMKAFAGKNKGNGDLQELLGTLVEAAREERPTAERLDHLFKSITKTTDDLSIRLFRSIEDDLGEGDLLGLMGTISAALPGIFLSAPFFTSFSHLFRSRDLIDALQRKFGSNSTKKKVLWFSDTINDMNGVSVTLHNFGRVSAAKDRAVKIVTSMDATEAALHNESYILNLPPIHSFNLPFYESQRLNIPSILVSLETIYHEEPDEILISTPGPVGLLGLLVARLLSVPAVGIYHTDFGAQATLLTGDDSVADVLETYTQWFYSMMSSVLVPTGEYMDVLEARGMDRLKMRPFPRGVNDDLFFPNPISGAQFCAKYDVEPGVNLLYVGRISKDKNIDFLLDVYGDLLQERQDINLIVVGTGPQFADIQRRQTQFPRLRLLGKLDQTELPEIYSSCDFFVFPSTTDTFGMVVAEALACGLPVVVSDVGGPQELFEPNRAGLILKGDDRQAWVTGLSDLIKTTTLDPTRYLELQTAARQSSVNRNDWERFLDEVVGDRIGSQAQPASQAQLV